MQIKTQCQERSSAVVKTPYFCCSLCIYLKGNWIEMLTWLVLNKLPFMGQNAELQKEHVLKKLCVSGGTVT